MKAYLFAAGCALGLATGLTPLRAAEAENSGAELEARIAAAVKSQDVTIIHFWAPWCPNCKAELGPEGWSRFIAANPRVHFIFVTIWNNADGRQLLAEHGVGAEPNFTLFLHPNASRARGTKVSTLLGLPISWIPTTWVFRDGKLRYALNFGELRFPILQQLVADTTNSWEH